MPKLREPREIVANRHLSYAIEDGLRRTGCTRLQLAQYMGVSYATIKRWIRNPQACTIDTFRKLVSKGVIKWADIERYLE